MLSNWFKGLFSPTRPFPRPAPKEPFVAIGDIHGRADLLKRALRSIKDTKIVCVGDYVDRGDDSAEVLRLLYARPDVVCLSGNHEEMMLHFLDHPQKHGPRWLRYGGLQTLASFGVPGASEAASGAALDGQSGNVAVVHAAADPAVPIDMQTTETLHWGHADFETTQREDNIWVLHGHTIVDTPHADRGRVSIDTGSYATGRLTAAWVSSDGVTFETV